jgi:hypothetical protein
VKNKIVSIRLFAMRGALTEAVTTEIQRVIVYCKGSASLLGDDRPVRSSATKTILRAALKRSSSAFSSPISMFRK